MPGEDLLQKLFTVIQVLPIAPVLREQQKARSDEPDRQQDQEHRRQIRAEPQARYGLEGLKGPIPCSPGQKDQQDPAQGSQESKGQRHGGQHDPGPLLTHLFRPAIVIIDVLSMLLISLDRSLVGEFVRLQDLASPGYLLEQCFLLFLQIVQLCPGLGLLFLVFGQMVLISGRRKLPLQVPDIPQQCGIAPGGLRHHLPLHLLALGL